MNNLTLVGDAWCGAPPDWVSALAEECDRTNQTATAKRIGVSAAMINQALRATYRGDIARLEARVRGELMRETLTCPVLGEISPRRCQDEQTRPYAATNLLRRELYAACRTCSHNRRTS